VTNGPAVRDAAGDVLIFAGAGAAATGAMTVFMERAFRCLPAHEQYPLPPREITDAVTEGLDVDRPQSRSSVTVVTFIAHFGFGIASALPLAALPRHSLRAATAQGVIWGLLVWSGAYLGALPALQILTPANQHPAGRTALMIVAHVVWGGTAGSLGHLMQRIRTKQ